MQLPTRTTQSDCGFLIMLYLVICKRSAKHRAGLIHIFPFEAMGIVHPISPGVIGLPKDAKQNLEYQTLQMKKHYYKRNHIYLCLDLHKGYIQ